MAVRHAGSRWNPGGADGTGRVLRLLRARWRTASMASGWRWPSDWGLPEVDTVCESVIEGSDLPTALVGLGRARARAGAGLDETLTDLAALHAVLDAPIESEGLVAADPDATPVRMLRPLVLAWADTAIGDSRGLEVTEALTGLATVDYLRARMAEIYAAARRHGHSPTDRHVLLTFTLDLSKVSGWPRLMAMVLVADVLRRVFDGGESLAVLGPSVAAVLSDRDPGLAARCAEARVLTADLFSVDPALTGTRRPELRLERLPSTEAAAQRLLESIRRA